MQKQEGPYPRQSSAERKEALFHDIIDYFDKGKVCVGVWVCVYVCVGGCGCGCGCVYECVCACVRYVPCRLWGRVSVSVP